MKANTLRTDRAGFSLLEIVVVVAILTLIAGVAVPVVAKVVEREARVATRTELDLLARASLEYLRDTSALPTAAANLGIDSGANGWSGPYLGSLGVDTKSGLNAHEVDGWSRPYRFRIAGSVLSIDSAGPDGAFGNGDDLLVRADATLVRRELTLATLKVLNQAVLNYNAVYQATDPLPANWSQALSRLVLRGYLPSATGLENDSFGSPFVAVPAGIAPLVRVGSTNVGTP
ncbi:MAG: prepilin-type N-terminal cleavage/methylation domain-containing protein [Planctomycetaceae bacterium]|nr:prepilin-type N-terminal cleavage/methylation domain-containing protein [Planctomycetaceae bacterium]